MTLWEKYVNKLTRHTDAREKIGLIAELYNAGVPSEDWDDILKNQGLHLRDIDLGKGLTLDLQQGGSMGDFPVDYGFNIRKRF